jgi:hypothetical protein
VGVEKLKDKRQKGTKYNQEGFQDKGKGEAVEKKGRCPLSEGSVTGGKTQCGEGVGGVGAGGDTVKKGSTKCPHNHQRSQCKNSGGGRICEHNRIRNKCKD